MSKRELMDVYIGLFLCYLGLMTYFTLTPDVIVNNHLERIMKQYDLFRELSTPLIEGTM
jgi:hypothetical protein